MPNRNKSIFITSYKRERILLLLLKRLKDNLNYNQFNKLVIILNGSKKLINLIKKIDHDIRIIETNYSDKYSKFIYGIGKGWAYPRRSGYLQKKNLKIF